MIPNPKPSNNTIRKGEDSQNNLTVLNDLIISYGNWPLQPLSPEGQLKIHSAPFRGSFPSVLSEAVRSAGLGSRVMVTQLLKGGVGQGPDGVVKLCGRMEWLRPDISYCINEKTLESKNKLETDSINQVWQISKDRLLNGELDQLVLDEVGLAISLGYIEERALISALEQRPVAADVVLTGPSIPQSVMALADQVTVLRSGI
tara:strand:+ start:471 stop:1076 length:606 start_codon:yes stop_codon:yes gene_type:complete